MEGDGEVISSPSVTSKQSFSDYLDMLCSYYLVCGVSVDEFWNGDYTNFKYYERAYQNKRRIHNEEMWLQGKYIADAIMSTVCRCLSDKNKAQYPDEPYPLTQKEAKEQEQRKAEREQKKLYESIMKRFTQLAKTGEKHDGYNKS